MKVSIEISLYPLRDDFIPPIRDFIESISAAPTVKVIRTDLSTQLFGDYDEVMNLLKNSIRDNWETWGKGSFVIKVLMDDLQGIGRD